jgi:hypothetical protein
MKLCLYFYIFHVTWIKFSLESLHIMPLNNRVTSVKISSVRVTLLIKFGIREIDACDEVMHL